MRQSCTGSRKKSGNPGSRAISHRACTKSGVTRLSEPPPRFATWGFAPSSVDSHGKKVWQVRISCAGRRIMHRIRGYQTFRSAYKRRDLGLCIRRHRFPLLNSLASPDFAHNLARNAPDLGLPDFPRPSCGTRPGVLGPRVPIPAAKKSGKSGFRAPVSKICAKSGVTRQFRLKRRSKSATHYVGLCGCRLPRAVPC